MKFQTSVSCGVLTGPGTPLAGSRRGRLALRATIVLALLFLLPHTGSSHIIREEPWHPVPAAYLRSLFYLKLQPVDWNLIQAEFEGVREDGWQLDTVYEGLAGAAELDGTDHAGAVRAAITSSDAEALSAAATRALSQLVRVHLRRAVAQLDTPGAAIEHVHEANRMYRAFDRFVRATDPQGAREIGRSWLELTTTVGTAGVENRGVRPADQERFTRAVGVIDSYLVANYEGAGDPSSTNFDAVPAAGRASVAAVAPWLPPGTDMNDQDPLPRLVLNFEERGVDEKDLFLVAYGDMLFDSPQIFGEPALSLGLTCSRCHNRSDINQRFFIPGISTQPGNVDVDGHYLRGGQRVRLRGTFTTDARRAGCLHARVRLVACAVSAARWPTQRRRIRCRQARRGAIQSSVRGHGRPSLQYLPRGEQQLPRRPTTSSTAVRTTSVAAIRRAPARATPSSIRRR